MSGPITLETVGRRAPRLPDPARTDLADHRLPEG
jgi:hypothetical protein